MKPDLNDLGIIGQRVPQIDLEKCRGCKVCQIENNCPIGVAKMADGKITIDEAACNHCGRCVGKCPFHAVEDYTNGYRIYIGGRWGKKVAQGRYLDKVFTDKEEVLEIVEKQSCCSASRESQVRDLPILLQGSDSKMFRSSF